MLLVLVVMGCSSFFCFWFSCVAEFHLFLDLIAITVNCEGDVFWCCKYCKPRAFGYACSFHGAKPIKLSTELVILLRRYLNRILPNRTTISLLTIMFTVTSDPRNLVNDQLNAEIGYKNKSQLNATPSSSPNSHLR